MKETEQVPLVVFMHQRTEEYACFSLFESYNSFSKTIVHAWYTATGVMSFFFFSLGYFSIEDVIFDWKKKMVSVGIELNCEKTVRLFKFCNRNN